MGQTNAMTDLSVEHSKSLLKPGSNCWRVETADRFGVLMENDMLRH